MPAPNSIIPSSGPTDLVSTISWVGVAPGRARILRAYQPSVPETEFKKRFPSPFKVQAVTIYEAQRKCWATDRSYLQLLFRFRYVSPDGVPIIIQNCFY